ncbi:MAG: peptide-methionine (S)-S-oxide reductase MsrA [Nitrospira sp.]
MPRLQRLTILAGSLVMGVMLIGIPSGVQSTATTAKAYFAGGCFWSMELAFEQVDGVLEAVSGYMGGTVANPTYEQVTDGKTGHVESVEVTYDPSRVSYQKLLDTFWHNVDPVTPNGQFCDYGNQYRSVVFYTTEDEKRLSEESKQTLDQSKRLPAPIVTRLLKASAFYPAEDYHQDFYKKNPLRYKAYKIGCGRTQRLEALWGKR